MAFPYPSRLLVACQDKAFHTAGSYRLASRCFVARNSLQSRSHAIQAGIVDRASDQSFIPPGFLPSKPPPPSITYRHHHTNTPYWQHIGIWRAVSEEEFLSYRWQVANTIDRKDKLLRFLAGVLPERTPQPPGIESSLEGIKTRDDFIADVEAGIKAAPMAVRLTPHILSVADWSNPLVDPIRRQFVPLQSTRRPDHEALSFDSLHETADSPVPGLVHRYPDKVLFLATSVCPVYCRFCTRSYAVGSNTESVTKASQRPTRKRWEAMFEYIEQNPEIQDVVVSGGDSYYLQPEQLRLIGERLLSIPQIQRFRFATKGLAVCPMRILDNSDAWSETFIALSDQGRQMGKQVAMHTHFNHPREITWATTMAAKYLFSRGVTVRNQTVLLRGVNDDVPTMSLLIRKLADLNITPYYVYQSDLIRGVEDLRTPLSTILRLEKHLRGTIAGFMMPSFVVDLPGGGGKRLANSFESYDEETGLSTWKAPGVAGDEVFTYHDPVKD
ncbi:hypothetical protein M409DRAFT_20438 [Zasmidium cellare ATCC 36951]|uniref:Radical SAM core domain-containing protein n=1 Tax=Zasmidium cellare ATCC 36951 TaxID=1080233 RepID=A0A6A6CQ38_ZASCE|nr:uncharacterized protein M409DRAFT_20438 [Zasmidium cellare ATCC 36951]KAF2169215.1 hypothetical protein M409DRAFT_20438 [Zasmidium cellare ATCC 36951]